MKLYLLQKYSNLLLKFFIYLLAMIYLEKFTFDDIECLIGWVPSSRFLFQWAGYTFSFPPSYSEFEQHLTSSMSESADIKIFKVVDLISNRTVGHVEIARIDMVNRCATLARVIVGDSSLQRIPIKRATDRKIKTITGLHSSTLFCGGFEIKVL